MYCPICGRLFNPSDWYYDYKSGIWECPCGTIIKEVWNREKREYETRIINFKKIKKEIDKIIDELEESCHYDAEDPESALEPDWDGAKKKLYSLFKRIIKEEE